MGTKSNPTGWLSASLTAFQKDVWSVPTVIARWAPHIERSGHSGKAQHYRFALSSYPLLSALIGELQSDAQIEAEIDAQLQHGDYSASDAWAAKKIRLARDRFRRDVLANFRGCCCVCRVDLEELLDAAHIRSWEEDLQNRLNPANGLSLCTLHHRAFDRKIIGFDSNRRITVRQLKSRSQVVRDQLDRYRGTPMVRPLIKVTL
jgi:predicted restriction endonuclease